MTPLIDYNLQPTPHPRLRPFWRWTFGLGAIALIMYGLFQITGPTVSFVRHARPGDVTADIAANITPISQDPEYALPKDDPNRLNILVLGIRGKADVADGGSLTDTIMLFSLDKTTGAAAMTSIPRDLTLRVTDTKTEKINTIYVYQGLAGAKKLFSRITGVSIDNVVLVDFTAFQDVVDQLGGVTVTLAQPFSEAQQWAGTASESYVFSLPAGTSTLDGQQALYYVRSRYSTSDFDRARRQQQVILAIKDKIQALHLNQDPIKALQLILAVKKNIDTDLGIFDLGTLKDLIGQGDKLNKIRRYQITTDNLVYQTKVNGIYELLPYGDTLAHIHEFFQTELGDHPVLYTPPPTPTTSTTP